MADAGPRGVCRVHVVLADVLVRRKQDPLSVVRSKDEVVPCAQRADGL